MTKNVWVLAIGLVLPPTACGGDDGEGEDDSAGSVGATQGGGDTGADDGASESSGAEAGDSESGATTGADTGAEDAGTFGGMCSATDECTVDEDCGGGTCVDCACVGGDSGGSGAMCPSNVSTGNMACDSCLAESCCSEFQTCFGDETVTMETECLQLNNCIVENCGMAMDVASLQECVNTNCPDTAGEFNNWVSFTQCLGTSCMSQCAG